MTTRKNNNEVLYDNLLDSEIKALFMPFHTLQTFFMLPKYKIYNNYIIFNSLKVDLLSTFSFIIPITCSFVHFIYYFPLIKRRYTYFAATMCWDLFFYSSGHIINYILTIIYKQINVELVLNFQRVIKMFKFNQYNFAKFNITSWIIVGFTVIYFIVLQFFYIFCCKRPVLNALPDIFVIHFVFSAIYCIRVINMITIQLRLWIDELKRLQALTRSSIIKNETFSKYNETNETLPMSKKIGQQQYSMKQEWKRLYNIYRKILKTYAIYNKLFQMLILHCGIASFVTSMINVQFWIELENLKWDSYKKNVYKISISMLAIKDVFINCAISFACQKFYTTLRKAEIACIETLNCTNESAARETCKNVLRYNAVAFHKIQACRLYEVDATLPLRLMMSIVSYAVVLIQLAFIK